MNQTVKLKIHLNKWVWLFAILFLRINGLSAQQTDTIKGRVIDSSAISIVGVNIYLPNHKLVGTTDSSGNFMVLGRVGTTLTFSSIGFQDLNVVYNGQDIVATLMPSNTSTLDAVVVVGYGSQKKRDVVGATVSVSGDKISETHSISAVQGLQGQASGVQITANSGQPGESLKVRIRGVGTNGDANPLYVVDGVPTTDISYLNSTDIQSMDVLKDAASAAIYGTRAANGVIMITTRKGRAGHKTVSFDAYYGIQNWGKTEKLLNGKQYATIMNEEAANEGYGDNYFYSDNYIDSVGNGSNWQDAAKNKNAPMQNYSLGFSGGNDNSVYSGGLSYQAQNGIIGSSDRSYYKRLSFKINSEHKIYKDLLVAGENLTFSHSTASSLATSGIYYNAIRPMLNVSPLIPVYNADGSFGKDPDDIQANPIAQIDSSSTNKTITDRLVGNTYLQVNILKNLKFRSDIGIDLMEYSYNSFLPTYSLSTTSYNTYTTATQGMYRYFVWNWDNTVNYSFDAQKSHFDILLGTEAMKQDTFYVSGSKQELIVADFDHAVINSGTNESTKDVSGNKSTASLNSYFGRLNYAFDDKYLLTAIVRRDGSSKFAPGHRWGTFPSFSAGWIASDETFLHNVSWINFLKIRGGWGRSGSDKIGNNLYNASTSTSYTGYYFGGSDATDITVGSAPSTLSNETLTWEVSQQTNVGFDAILFKHLNFTFDWYNKTTKNWLISTTIPDISGFTSQYINGGDVQNKGIEISSSYNGRSGDLRFNIGGNISFNTNKARNVPTSDGIIHGSTSLLYSGSEEFFRVQSGFPIGYFWGYKTDGIFQTQAEVQNYKSSDGTVIQPNAVPGDVKFKDLNGDGSIDTDDKTQIGNPYPKFNYGINLSFNYKGFDLTVIGNGVYGNQIFDATRNFGNYYSNYNEDIMGRWTGEGTSNRLPRVTMNSESNGNWSHISDLWIHSGSFFRVRTITLGYDFVNSILTKTPFEQLHFYISATNPFLFTKYHGIDPEVGYGDVSWSTGVDYGYYAQPRSFMIGVSARF